MLTLYLYRALKKIRYLDSVDFCINYYTTKTEDRNRTKIIIQTKTENSICFILRINFFGLYESNGFGCLTFLILIS